MRTDGSAACWGYGSAYDYAQQRPLALPDAGPWSKLTAGDGHSCGPRVDGRSACWGPNYYGELGNYDGWALAAR